jgi:hypothetical protein
MNLGMKTHKWIQQVFRALMRYIQQNSRPDSGASDREPVVFAVTNRYPTRLVLYAAAFQGGWKVHFMKSLRQVVAATRTEKPKAVFYDHAAGDPAWDYYCATLSREGVPFVLLANKNIDETFLVVLAAGGYQAWGDPLTSEEIVQAVEFAGEVATLARVPVT